MKSLRVVEVLECAKPLIFENSEAEFQYSLQGTYFLVRFRSRYYAITAKHCLRNRTYESIRIRLDPGSLEFLSWNVLVTPREGDDLDFLDLAFLEIESAGIPGEVLRSKHFLDLDSYAERILGRQDILAVVGYPTELNTVDYDKFVVSTKGFSADGHYDGPAEDTHCSRIRFNSLSSVEDLDGMSGSPVIAFEAVRDKIYRHYFAGVLIRATKESGTGRFVNSAIVVDILKRVSAAA